MSTRPLVPVVAGVLYREDGAFLLSSRPAGKPYAGYWEFAGGKVEAGESDLAALQREFQEELGITVLRATPWLTRIHEYEHARVRLCFYRIVAHDWEGELQSREGQQWLWCTAQSLAQPDAVSPMLPANAPILAALRIPQSLSGSLKQGLRANDLADDFKVLYWRDVDQPDRLPDAVWAKADEYTDAHARYPSLPVWVLSDGVHMPEEAQAVIWPVSDRANVLHLQNILNSGFAVPVLALAAEAFLADCATPLIAAGIHGIITDTSA